MKTITIIGAGMMGSALAFPARENGNEVRLVGTHLDREIIDGCRNTGRHPKFNKDFPEGVKYYQIEELTTAITGADFIICGVSSFGVEWFRDEILPKLKENIPVISVTKGLMNTEDGSLLTYLDIWQEKLDALGKNIPLNAIGGPCTSYELVAHDQTEVTFCGKDMSVLRMIKAAMATDYYHISLSTDIVGVESAVALKNGFALGIALTIGLNQKAFGLDSELHFNSQAAVFGQAVREMAKLLKMQGADELDNLVLGAGDLYVTVYGGRTRLVGVLLGRGLNIDEAKAELAGVTLESLVVAERVAKAVRVKAEKGLVNLEDFPLLMHIDEIITQKKAVNIPWESFTFETETKTMNYWTQSNSNIFVAAHRGWRSKYPENTLEGFKAALTLDVDQLETDVRVTKDGELVLIHDATVDRTTNGQGKVCEMTFAELRELDAGNGTKIPTLIEFMELVKDHPTITLDIELKEYPIDGWEETAYSVCDRVLKIIDDYNFTDRCVINTWNGKLHEYINDTYGDKYKQHVYYPIRHLGPCTRDPYIYGYSTCVFGLDQEVTIDEVQQLSKRTGVRLWAGTYAKDEKSVNRAVEMGAELITCDNPDEVLQILKNKKLHK